MISCCCSGASRGVSAPKDEFLPVAVLASSVRYSTDVGYVSDIDAELPTHDQGVRPPRTSVSSTPLGNAVVPDV